MQDTVQSAAIGGVSGFAGGYAGGASGGIVGSYAGGFAGGVTSGAIGGAASAATASALTPGSNRGEIWTATYQGAGTGALTGAALYGGRLLGQSINNWTDGYGFRTNNGVLNEMAAQGQGQNMVDFASLRYGTAPGVFNPNDPNLRPNDYAYTDLNTGKVVYGNLILKYPSAIQATGWHEGVHVTQSGGNWPSANRYVLETDAGRSTIGHAQLLDLSSQQIRGEIDYYNFNASKYGGASWHFR
jgi:hypothetical protein